MAGTIYTIDYTNPLLPGKQSFQVQPGSFDGPELIADPNKCHTSLHMIGMGFMRYGEKVNENFIRLLESFANNVPPLKPTTGQLWFDTSVNTLKVYNGSLQNWSPAGGVLPPSSFLIVGANSTKFYIAGDVSSQLVLGQQFIVDQGPNAGYYTIDSAPGSITYNIGTNQTEVTVVELIVTPIGGGTILISTQPLSPQLGQLWFNVVDGRLYVWDGAIWSVILSGNHSGDIDMGGTHRVINLPVPADATDAVTKQYVDSLISGVSTTTGEKVSKAGDVMTGSLTLSSNPVLDMHAATKQYVDAGLDGKLNTSHSSAADPHPQYMTFDEVMAVAGTGGGSGGFTTSFDFTAVAGQTVFNTGATLSSNNAVLVRGVELASDDYTVSGTTVTLIGMTLLAGTPVVVRDFGTPIDLESPAFTGFPTAPTAPVNTNTTQIATTAFVMNQGYITSAPTYNLPTASASTLGGVKIGSGLNIDGSGVLSASFASGGSTYIPTLVNDLHLRYTDAGNPYFTEYGIVAQRTTGRDWLAHSSNQGQSLLSHPFPLHAFNAGPSGASNYFHFRRSSVELQIDAMLHWQWDMVWRVAGFIVQIRDEINNVIFTPITLPTWTGVGIYTQNGITCDFQSTPGEYGPQWPSTIRVYGVTTFNYTGNANKLRVYIYAQTGDAGSVLSTSYINVTALNYNL